MAETKNEPTIEQLLNDPNVYVAQVLESHCKYCDALSDLRFGACYGCAEAESIIVDGVDMHDNGLDGRPAVTPLEKTELLVKKGWLSPRLAKQQLDQLRARLEQAEKDRDVLRAAVEHYANRANWARRFDCGSGYHRDDPKTEVVYKARDMQRGHGYDTAQAALDAVGRK